MLERYTRMAVSLADLRYEPFPDVTMAIPELAAKRAEVCPDCAAKALSTSLSTTTQTGANGRKRRSSGPRKEAESRQVATDPAG